PSESPIVLQRAPLALIADPVCPLTNGGGRLEERTMRDRKEGGKESGCQVSPAAHSGARADRGRLLRPNRRRRLPCRSARGTYQGGTSRQDESRVGKKVLSRP